MNCEVCYIHTTSRAATTCHCDGENKRKSLSILLFIHYLTITQYTDFHIESLHSTASICICPQFKCLTKFYSYCCIVSINSMGRPCKPYNASPTFFLFFNITISYNNNNKNKKNGKYKTRLEKVKKPSENGCCCQLLNLTLHIWSWHYSPTLLNQNAFFCPK